MPFALGDELNCFECVGGGGGGVVCGGVVCCGAVPKANALKAELVKRFPGLEVKTTVGSSGQFDVVVIGSNTKLHSKEAGEGFSLLYLYIFPEALLCLMCLCVVR